jgi:DNA-binding NtrC family response regulator
VSPTHDVLLVDDDADFTHAVRTLLDRGGYRTTVSHTAAEGVAVARRTPFSVALLDVVLPDADGLSVINQLATVDRLLPVICLTGRGDTSSVVRAIRLGAVDYLTKPVDRATLFNAVNSAAEHCAARRAGTEGIAAVPMPTGESPAWRRVIELLTAAAAAPRTTVLLTGEPGVGKEVAASTLHRLSKRHNRPLISANAACFCNRSGGVTAIS